jgi:hypothetical protein
MELLIVLPEVTFKKVETEDSGEVGHLDKQSDVFFEKIAS